MEIDRSVELLFMNQQHIHENSKFADQKAVQILSIDGVLYANFLGPYACPQPYVILLVCFVLAAGTALSVMVINPRGHWNEFHGAGIVDPARIAIQTIDKFKQESASITDNELLDELRTLLYDRARIDRRKYFFLRRAIWVSAGGWVATVVVVAWSKLYALAPPLLNCAHPLI